MDELMGEIRALLLELVDFMEVDQSFATPDVLASMEAAIHLVAAHEEAAERQVRALLAVS